MPRRAEQLASPAKRLAGFIAKFDPAIAKLVRSARAVLRKRMPTAVELVYDNYNALAVAFGPNEHATHAIVSLAVFARGVNLYFIHGATLPDPRRRLEGNGSRGRFVRLESVATLDEPAVEELLRAAIRLSKAPLPASGRGSIVIKSALARHRPRRP